MTGIERISQRADSGSNAPDVTNASDRHRLYSRWPDLPTHTHEHKPRVSRHGTKVLRGLDSGEAVQIVPNVAAAPIGGLIAFFLTHTIFPVRSGVECLALFDVSVQMGVIILE